MHSVEFYFGTLKLLYIIILYYILALESCIKLLYYCTMFVYYTITLQ